jgi:hypothetical protein
MSDPNLKDATRLLMEGLAALDIAAVEISYDGEGDSGQIGDIVARGTGDRIVSLDATLGLALWSDRESRTRTVYDVLEEYAWELLRHYHEGFENCDGGYGTITLNVSEGTAVIDHNDRITDVVETVTEV